MQHHFTKICDATGVTAEVIRQAFLEEFHIHMVGHKGTLYLPFNISPAELFIYMSFASGVKSVLAESDGEQLAILLGLGAGLTRGHDIVMRAAANTCKRADASTPAMKGG